MAKTRLAKPVEPSFLPKQFDVFVGGYFDPASYSIRLEDGTLVLRKGVLCEEQTIQINPSPEAWQRFSEALDRLGAWKWREKYWQQGAMDGTQWHVDIQLGGKKVKCDGSNCYPLEDGSPSDEPTKVFGGFEKALKQLLGIKRA
jgi:hypothetical protein